MCFTGIPVLFYSEDGDNLNLIDWNDLVSIIFRGGSRTAVTSKTERFVIIVNGCKPLTIITKHSVLDVAAVLDPSLYIFPIMSNRKNSLFIHSFIHSFIAFSCAHFTWATENKYSQTLQISFWFVIDLWLFHVTIY